MTRPLVVKFGGDALATPERIAAAARRVIRRLAAGPVVAVASARRGVTDHLLQLVEQVREAAGGTVARNASVAADRAVTSGEVVAASLLAVALGESGVTAAVLDAREAGLLGGGRAGAGALVGVRPSRVRRLLQEGVAPVVTGFQGWDRDRVTALGRGGSDITAVALAVALDARECELVKDPGALHTADPRLVHDARPIRAAGHRFVTDLALAGARVIHHDAAARAERDGLPLRFTALRADGEPATSVAAGEEASDARSIVLAPGCRASLAVEGDPAGLATVTAVLGRPHAALEDALLRAADGSRVDLLRATREPHALRFLLHGADGPTLVRQLHTALTAGTDDEPWRMHAAYA